jgi:hypothetical protein
MAALADRDFVEAGWPGYEIRCDMRRLGVEDCVVALRMQQHFVQTPEHAVCLQQLRALCFDALLVWGS